MGDSFKLLHIEIIPFNCWVASCGRDIPQLIYYSHIERHLGNFKFWLLQIKLLQMYRLLCEHESSFLWDKSLVKWWQGCMLVAAPEWLCHFPFPLAAQRCSSLLKIWPPLDANIIFDSNHSNRCVVISHCVFNFSFLNG